MKILFAFAIATTVAHADPIAVNAKDNVVDGSFIKDYSNKWELFGTAPNGSIKQLGTWSDDVKITRLGGREVILRKQVWNYGTGTETYLNIVDHKTLLPIVSNFTATPGFYYRFEYAGDAKSAKYQRTGDPGIPVGTPMQQGTMATPAPAWEFNAGMFGLLIAGFPLKEGYSAKFPVFRTFAPSNSVAWVDFTVGKKQKFYAGAGKPLVEGWSVVAHSPATQETMRFGLTRDPPYILELRQEWEGRDWTFQMM